VTVTASFSGNGDNDPSSGTFPLTINPAATTTTITTAPPPIPEYPLGLPLLAIFAVLAYGVIRRRTRN
jgi:hypothetical protein